MDAVVSKSGVVPFSLKDAPSLIERLWPAQKISVEAQKERKAGAGQTLTALGSYWKGRKPLILVRACVLASLLPATGRDEDDLTMFETLMGMSDDQISSRFNKPVAVSDIQNFGSESERAELLVIKDDSYSVKKLLKSSRLNLMSSILSRMPYQLRVENLSRVEEIDEGLIINADHMAYINKHLGTEADDLASLVEQLGIMRFGHRPIVADTFAGGGSIPFEAARVGCDVVASDLNPIACMLTWGAFEVIGGDISRRQEIEKKQRQAINVVEEQIAELRVELDRDGNRAKSFLYCLETRCPQTGWLVPMSTSWVISGSHNVVAKLIPDTAKKRYNIQIVSGVSDQDVVEASNGTVRDGFLVHSVDEQVYRTSLKAMRGDRRGVGGETINNLRLWEKHDVVPRSDDIFNERLYCIQWIEKATINSSRPRTFFRSVTHEDVEREQKVIGIVQSRLFEWQRLGIVPDMKIEKGEKTDELVRTRGWMYWHHLFHPRHLLTLGLLQECSRDPELSIQFCRTLNLASRLCLYNPRSKKDQRDPKIDHVFLNQAFNTLANYGVRGCSYLLESGFLETGSSRPISGSYQLEPLPAEKNTIFADIFITDPPYADAVIYHEITEYFIASIRNNPPDAFNKWIWDSRRPLAIKGEGNEFRRNMVAAYKAMADHMPDHGLQIVMFTHQDAGVWGDMAQIFWGSGLRVMAAWYIATETTSELKKGGYVQGTVILVLRKRQAGENGYKDEIVQEVKVEVADQIDTMSGLNQSLKGRGRIENLFEDADLQMAGYAAALRVLTKYTSIDGVDMTKEALRPRAKGERSLVSDIIEFAVQVANEHMVPEGMSAKIWESLTGAERFYFKMVDIEETGAKKLDNYQNFAKAFRVAKYDDLMGSMEPNKARLKKAKEFRKSGFEGSEFGPSKSRALLFGIYEIQNEIDGEVVLSHLRDMVPDYFNVREDLMSLADYVAKKRAGIDESEARAAGILHGLLRNERFG